ncbi:MAG: DEAD/DEAH box helicase [Bdellovibrionales bacterium]|nr:DEAD/DEAH box helicase [Bdellovibrionales bacterium]
MRRCTGRPACRAANGPSRACRKGSPWIAKILRAFRAEPCDDVPMNSLQALIAMGDLLDSTDNVEELNGIGFNRADKSAWPSVRGNERAMALLLHKYQLQLMKRGVPGLEGVAIQSAVDWMGLMGGNNGFDATALALAREEKAKALAAAKARRREEAKALQAAEAAKEKGNNVLLSLEGGRLGARLNPSNRCPREAFNAFVAFVRMLGGKCQPSKGYLWELPAHADGEALRTAMAASGLTCDAVTEGYAPAASPDPATKTADVTLHLRETGEIAIFHPYCAKMNAAYRDAEEVSGVIGFDWDQKCRVVGEGEVADLREVLAAIGRVHSEWKVEAKFDLEGHIADAEEKRRKRRTPAPEWQRLLREGIEVKPHQAEGVRFLEECNGRAMNGDDMGLGKTFQALLYAAIHGRRVLVVCPKNVRRQWIEEASKFFVDGTFRGLELDSSARPNELDLGGHNLVTVNYESLKKFAPRLRAEAELGGLDMLVVDESHRIKNPSAQTTQEVLALGALFPYVVELSGTPIKNKKAELYTQATLLHPGVFASEDELAGMTFYQARQRVKLFFIRRTKKDELASLPEKTRQVVPVQGRGLPDYGQDLHVMTLKSMLAQAKVPQTLEFVEDLLANTSSKVIVFSDSDDAADAIAQGLGNRAVLHTGATPHEKREAAKASFCDEASAARVFVATTGSAREGLNLTVADKEVFNDLPWTPANLAQAEDRAYRMGQKNAVNVYWMLAKGNRFDQRNVQLMARKMAIYKKVVDGKKVTAEEEKFLSQSMEALMGVQRRDTDPMEELAG